MMQQLQKIETEWQREQRMERMHRGLVAELTRWGNILEFRNVPGTDKYVISRDEINAIVRSIAEAIR